MMAGAGGATRATGWRATAIRFQQLGRGGPRVTISLIHSRARGAHDGGRRRRRDSYPVSTTAVRGPRVPSLSSTRAREALMMAGAGGAMRATGGARQPSGFNNCGEGASLYREYLYQI